MRNEADRKERADCRCTIEAEITGQDELGICECETLTYEMEANGRIGVLKAKLPDGSVLFRRAYNGSMTSACSGGGAIVGHQTWTWSVTVAGNSLVIRANVAARYKCPDESIHDISASSTITVRLYTAPCRVFVLSVQSPLVLPEIGHTAIQVMCGEFDVIYGLYATDMSMTAVTAGVAAEVRTNSSAELTDGIGENYNMFYPTYDKLLWEIQVPCSVCQKLRAWWEAKKAAPGNYRIVPGNGYDNCASAAVESLVAAGVLAPMIWPPPNPGYVENMLEHGPQTLPSGAVIERAITVPKAQ